MLFVSVCSKSGVNFIIDGSEKGREVEDCETYLTRGLQLIKIHSHTRARGVLHMHPDWVVFERAARGRVVRERDEQVDCLWSGADLVLLTGVSSGLGAK